MMYDGLLSVQVKHVMSILEPLSATLIMCTRYIWSSVILHLWQHKMFVSRFSWALSEAVLGRFRQLNV